MADFQGNRQLGRERLNPDALFDDPTSFTPHAPEFENEAPAIPAYERYETDIAQIDLPEAEVVAALAERVHAGKTIPLDQLDRKTNFPLDQEVHLLNNDGREAWEGLVLSAVRFAAMKVRGTMSPGPNKTFSNSGASYSGNRIRDLRIFRSSPLPLSDRYQVANIGVMKAALRYDPNKDPAYTSPIDGSPRRSSFLTYAMLLIENEIGRAVDKERGGAIPTHMYAYIAQVARAGRWLEEKWGRQPTAAEIANYMTQDNKNPKPITPAEARRMVRLHYMLREGTHMADVEREQIVTELASRADEDIDEAPEMIEWAATVMDEAEASNDDTWDLVSMSMLQHDTRGVLNLLIKEARVNLETARTVLEKAQTTDNPKAIERAEKRQVKAEKEEFRVKREVLVIILRHGLYGVGEHTLEEVGSIFGLKRERVRQIEAKALARLRHPKYSVRLRPYLKEEMQPDEYEERQITRRKEALARRTTEKLRMDPRVA